MLNMVGIILLEFLLDSEHIMFQIPWCAVSDCIRDMHMNWYACISVLFLVTGVVYIFSVWASSVYTCSSSR